jgi:hypothetical protein
MVRILRSLKVEILLFALVFFSHGYFYVGTAWNQIARYSTVYSLINPDTPDYGTFRINYYLKHPPRGHGTGDWARYQDNYYSNKAPGASILGAGPYFFLFHGQRAFGINPMQPIWIAFNEYFINLFVSVLWTAFGTVVFFRFLRQRYQFASTDAFLTTLVFGFCTLMFPFDGGFWGHTTAAAMILIGYYHLEQSYKPALAGLLLGLAVLVEYMAAISLAVAAAYLLMLPSRRTQIVRFVAGAAPSIVVLLIYHKICFGSYLTTAASLSDTLRRVEEGQAIAFGQFGTFQLDVFWKLLFSLERGIFIYMPVLFFAFLGALHLLRKGDAVWLAACVLNILLYVGAISCYVFWDGGWSTGARYLIVALPFFGLLLPSLDSMGRKTLALYIVLGAISFMNMLAIATVEAMAPDWLNPLYGEVYPRFIAGNFNENRLFFESLRHWLNSRAITPNRFNLGQLLFNLKGHQSLIPWVAVTSVLGLLLYRSLTPDQAGRYHESESYRHQLHQDKLQSDGDVLSMNLSPFTKEKRSDL